MARPGSGHHGRSGQRDNKETRGTVNQSTDKGIRKAVVHRERRTRGRAQVRKGVCQGRGLGFHLDAKRKPRRDTEGVGTPPALYLGTLTLGPELWMDEAGAGKKAANILEREEKDSQ